MNCSIAQCLEVVGEWWSLLIVRDCFFGVSRFEQFQERLGIARNMLTQRLQTLADHGIVERVAYQAHPVRYDYRLTAKGRDLWPVLETMRQWGDRWEAPKGPPLQMVHRRCGHVATARLICSACGADLELSAMVLQPGPGAGNPDRSEVTLPR